MAWTISAKRPGRPAGSIEPTPTCPHATSAAQQQRIIELRRQRRTYRQIAQVVGVSMSTIARILARVGLNRLSALEPIRPANRYVHGHPGDLLHLDVKKLGRFQRPGHRVTGHGRHHHSRGAGWEYVHVAIDDHSRIGQRTIHAGKRGHSASRALLVTAVHYYRSLGVTIRRVLTDNGGCYRFRVFAWTCRRLGIRHRRTKPYTPRTNGKAERFIQTALREWAYAVSYDSSDQRGAVLEPPRESQRLFRVSQAARA